MKTLMLGLLSALLLVGGVGAALQSTTDVETQSLVAAGIAQRVGSQLASSKQVSVKSVQKISFVQRPSKDVVGSQPALENPSDAVLSADAVSVEVEVESTMTPTTMKTTFKKRGSNQPDLVLELLVRNGVSFFKESHWYVEKNGYLESDPYPIIDTTGVEDLQTPHTIFAEIQRKGVPVCALSEFFFTWVGPHSTQIHFFRDVMLARATRVTKESRDGVPVFHLIRTRWDDQDDQSHGICTDHYFVSSDFKLVAWNSEFTDARFGSHVSYMVISRTYSYSNQ